MPLNYLRCFPVVLREIHRNFDRCQTDYSIHSKLEFFPYSEVIHTWKYIIQVNKRLTKVKEKQSTIHVDVFVLSFSSFQCHRQKVS